MAASVNDKITDTRNAARPNSARVSSPRSAGGTTLSCDNLVGWPTASKVHFVTYRIDSSSNPVAGTQLDCYGIVSGNNIGSIVVVDGTDTGNAINDVVEMLPTAAWGQDLADALTAAHDRLGVHKSGATYASPVFSGTFTGTYTIGGTITWTANIVPANALATSAILLGYTQNTTLSQTSASTSAVQVTNLTSTVTIPAGGRGVEITAVIPDIRNQGANDTVSLELWDGTVGSGTRLQSMLLGSAVADARVNGTVTWFGTPAAGTKTYNVAVKVDAGTAALASSSTSPAFILVKCV